MSHPTQQALLNSLTKMLVDSREGNAAWPEEIEDQANDLIAEILQMGDISDLVNVLQGIDWRASDGSYVTDIDLLIETADDQVGEFGAYAVKQTLELLEKEGIEIGMAPFPRSFQVELIAQTILSIEKDCPKALLATEYAALGSKVVERCLAIEMDTYAAEHASNLLTDPQTLDPYIDVRVIELSNTRNTVEIYFPDDAAIFDEIKDLLCELVLAQKEGIFNIAPVRHVPPAIPGYKDVIDYKRIIGEKAFLEKRITAERSAEMSGP